MLRFPSALIFLSARSPTPRHDIAFAAGSFADQSGMYRIIQDY